METSRPVLWIGHAFPPTGEVGVLRILSFIQSMADIGTPSIVITSVPDRNGVPEDAGLTVPAACTVLRVDPKARKLWVRLAARFPRSGSSRELFRFRWGNMYRGQWIEAAVRTALDELGRRPCRAIVSSGPPFSTHEIGYRIHQQTGSPWIMDVRDPWFPSTDPQVEAFRREHQERWFRAVSAVVASTPEIRDYLHAQGLPSQQRSFVVSNGYNDAECPVVTAPWPTEKFRLIYAGQLYGTRRIDPVLTALSQLVAEGSADPSRMEVVVLGASRPESIPGNVGGMCRFLPAVPRQGLASVCAQASVFLVLQPKEFAICVPTKLYEQLAMGRLILAAVPAGSPSAKLVEEFQAGRVAPLEDGHALKAAMLDFIRAWDRGTLKLPSRPPGVERYERRALAERFRTLLDAVS